MEFVAGFLWTAVTAYAFYRFGYSRGLSDGSDEMQMTHLD
jgi:hypothetical protein